MALLLFQDLVAVITGAGGGLGRIYALELAKRGASVVVNDLGSLRDGDGESSSPASKVVNDIKKLGGRAVANFDSVENGDRIIDCAIKAFGKIDILINNAGILRDFSFLNMSDDDWNKIQRVHVFGAYKTTKAAWKHMRVQNFGRIIFTTSASGIYGNFGQSNYSSAKSALIGLCKTLTIEGAKYNINCNLIAPVAGSRLTEDVLPQDFLDHLKPEYVSPLVLYLCHPSCQESGGLFEVGAGWVGKLRIECSKGKYFKLNDKSKSLTPEMISDSWSEIIDFSDSRHPSSIADSMNNFMEIIQKNRESTTDDNNSGDHKSLESIKGRKKIYNFNTVMFKDAILYALSVGVSNSNNCNLKYLYENHEQFSILPTYALIPSFDAVFDLIKDIFGSPQFNVDLSQVLHGEQYLEMYKPLKMNEKITASAEVVDVLDKIRGAIILVDVKLSNSNNEVISKSQFSLYLNGAGGFNGPRSSNKVIEVKKVPSRNPDKIIEKCIGIDQSPLYRLNGDFNPLHIDPEFAQLAGFDRPIVHGLYLFGLVSFEAIKLFGLNDAASFKRMKARFSNPVTPGQKVLIEFWQEPSLIHFQCKEAASGKVCLAGGFIELHDKPAIVAKL